MNPRYPAISERASRRCEYCRAPEEIFNFPFEVEHIVPRSRGGSDDAENLALACHSCNRFKSDFMSGFDPETQIDTRLFSPRRDRWEEHFELLQDSGAVRGITSTGRATVERLRLNRPQHVGARLYWMALGFFPGAS